MAIATFEPRSMQVGVLTAALQELTPREQRDPDPDLAIEDWLGRTGVEKRATKLLDGFEAWKLRKDIDKAEFSGLPYLMLHFQKPPLEAVGSIIAGMALGMVALHTRSIYAGMMIHIAVAWSMDLLALYHKGDLMRLLGP